jgi:hypothetical protein
MGYSVSYILFIGLAEVMGAWLLLWNRTKLIGVAILLPVMINVVVFDIIFLDEYGALASALIYTLLLFVLFCYKDKVTQAFQALVAEAPSTPMPFRQKLAIARSDNYGDPRDGPARFRSDACICSATAGGNFAIGLLLARNRWISPSRKSA